MPNRDYPQQRRSIPVHSPETVVIMVINAYIIRRWVVSIRDLRRFAANPYSTGVTLVSLDVVAKKKERPEGRPFYIAMHSTRCNQSLSADFSDFSGFLLSLAGFSAGSVFFSSSLDLEVDDRPCPEGDL
jgi:hypothetical protein